MLSRHVLILLCLLMFRAIAAALGAVVVTFGAMSSPALLAVAGLSMSPVLPPVLACPPGLPSWRPSSLFWWLPYLNYILRPLGLGARRLLTARSRPSASLAAQPWCSCPYQLEPSRPRLIHRRASRRL